MLLLVQHLLEQCWKKKNKRERKEALSSYTFFLLRSERTNERTSDGLHPFKGYTTCAYVCMYDIGNLLTCMLLRYCYCCFYFSFGERVSKNGSDGIRLALREDCFTATHKVDLILSNLFQKVALDNWLSCLSVCL